jgi:hypothetical protein
VGLLLDRERRGRLAENARTWAEHHLSWSNGVAAFEELYEALARARTGSPTAATPG